MNSELSVSKSCGTLIVKVGEVRIFTSTTVSFGLEESPGDTCKRTIQYFEYRNFR